MATIGACSGKVAREGDCLPSVRVGRTARADAVRSHARVVAAAHEAFAVDGIAMTIDDVALRAGVGVGTVYRAYPTKSALIRAIIEDRMWSLIAEGRALFDSERGGGALGSFIRLVVLGGIASDRGLADAFASRTGDRDWWTPELDAGFSALLGDLIEAAREAGTLRSDLNVHAIEALIVGCQAIHAYDSAEAERLVGLVIDRILAPTW